MKISNHNNWQDVEISFEFSSYSSKCSNDSGEGIEPPNDWQSLKALLWLPMADFIE